MTTRADCLAMDRQDPLAGYRDRFDLPDGTIYLDGNSLGPLPRCLPDLLETTVREQWGRDLVASWNEHGWIDLPARLGQAVAPLLGATEDEVLVADSTTVNLYKLLVAGLRMRPERRRLVIAEDTFPSDLYVAGEAAAVEGRVLDPVPADGLVDAIDDDVALVTASHVDFRTGARLDLPGLTATARTGGALALWDLSHSVGVIDLDLDGWGVDLAVGCTYKFLNGGPGAPAFLYVARRHHDSIRSPLPGWLGHAEPFAFEPDYRPASGVLRFQCGTPNILSAVALAAALEVFEDLDAGALEDKASRLGDLFLALVEERCPEVGVVSPRDRRRRGAQVSLSHPEGYGVVRALIDRGIVGDFRPPDLIRCGLSPLILRSVDVWDAVDGLRSVLDGREWARPEYRTRRPVT